MVCGGMSHTPTANVGARCAPLERLVVLTKADKVSKGQRGKMRDQVRQKLNLEHPPAAVSVKTGEGRHELLVAIGELARRWSEEQRGD